MSSSLRRIVVAYTVNELGTWFGYVALSVAVYDHTHSAIAVAGLFVAGRFLPALLVPAIVARVEASPRRGELSGLYVIEAVCASALGVLLWHFWLPALLMLVALDGTAAFAANALLRAAAARTAADEARSTQPATGSADTLAESADTLAESADMLAETAARRANAALNIGFTATVALGPAIAGIAVAALGGSAALFIDAGSFLACGAMLIEIRPHIEEAGGSSARARIAAAWSHLRAAPQLRAILTAEAVAIIFFTLIQPVEVLYAKGTLHAGDRGFGLLLAAWGAGMVVGGLVFARSLHRPLGPMLTGGTLLVGLAYLGYAVAPSLAVACAAGVAGGIGNGVQWASLISTVQTLTPGRLHGQLMGAVQSINSLFPALGYVLGGALATLASPRSAFLVAGVAVTVLTVAFLRVATGAGLRSTGPPGPITPDPGALVP